MTDTRNRHNIRIAPMAQAIPYQQLAAQHDTPLFVLDLAKARAQYRALANALPNVELFYAIKSLPNRELIQTLRDEGASFDLATSGEIELVRPLGLNPRHTLHSHPIKRKKDIQSALRFGCTTFVVDNMNELEKFRPFRHRVGILIRIGFKNPNAVCDLARKFGCQVEEVSGLIEAAEAYGIHIEGLSFHVGSQCEDATHHAEAIRVCASLIELQKTQHQRWLSVLDIGGGFPANYSGSSLSIEDFCAPIREALAELPDRIRIYAEPGRFISAAAASTVSRVMGKALRSDGKHWYFLDDGVYGSFSGMVYDHATYPLTVFSDEEISDPGQLNPSVLAGPTCDSIDVIADDIELPELQIGDLVIAEQMGAYSVASATDFNLFERATVVSFDSELVQSQIT